ncbi:MAG: hypothetical protein JWM36_2193 [Hyphomicrobiales bacterium]|nr:hypothetical protein [Hyphomicrobiales bacterium]
MLSKFTRRLSIALILGTMIVHLGSTAARAIGDRNNEFVCSERGNVDPRCY